MIVYPIGASDQKLLFHPEVIARFQRHQQLRWWQREAGGQLFARFQGTAIHVVEATGARRSDRRAVTTTSPITVPSSERSTNVFLSGCISSEIGTPILKITPAHRESI